MEKGSVTVADEDLRIRLNKRIIEKRQHFISMRAANRANNGGDSIVAEGGMELLASNANRFCNSGCFRLVKMICTRKPRDSRQAFPRARGVDRTSLRGAEGEIKAILSPFFKALGIIVSISFGAEQIL